MVKKKKGEFIEEAHREGLMWMVLASLVSSDSLLGLEDCKKSLRMIVDLIDDIAWAEEVPWSDRITYMDYLVRAIGIIEGEVGRFKEGKVR